MNCIFCKSDSSLSRSKEHIIPESLGNLEHTLPPGIVCDNCNNYFAREVENPFLSSLPILTLRFEQALPNKRGRIPPVTGVISPGFPITAFRDQDDDGKIKFEIPHNAAEKILQQDRGTIVLPSSLDFPEGQIVSRFLAKVALEAFAARILDTPEHLTALALDSQLDPLRDHARKGAITDWPFHSRRIYEVDKAWYDLPGAPTQILHEFDILITAWQEWFFVLAIFGLELAINLGGPDIAGYSRWLEENDHVSPLYFGKNARA